MSCTFSWGCLVARQNLTQKLRKKFHNERNFLWVEMCISPTTPTVVRCNCGFSRVADGRFHQETIDLSSLDNTKRKKKNADGKKNHTKL